MKNYIKQAIQDGKSLLQVRNEVVAELVSQALVKTYGNQTEAAKLIKANRHTIRAHAKAGKR